MSAILSQLELQLSFVEQRATLFCVGFTERKRESLSFTLIHGRLFVSFLKLIAVLCRRGSIDEGDMTDERQSNYMHLLLSSESSLWRDHGCPSSEYPRRLGISGARSEREHTGGRRLREIAPPAVDGAADLGPSRLSAPAAPHPRARTSVAQAFSTEESKSRHL